LEEKKGLLLSLSNSFVMILHLQYTCYSILLSKSKAGYMKILEGKWARQASFGILPQILLTST